MSERTPQDVLRELRAAVADKVHPKHGARPFTQFVWSSDLFTLLDKAIAEAPDSPPVLVTAVRRLLDEYDAYRDPDGDESPDGWMDALEEVRSTIDAVTAPDSPPGWDSETMRALLSDGTTAAPDTLSEKPETLNPSFRPPVLLTTAGTRIVDNWPYSTGPGDSYGRRDVARLVEAVENEAAAFATLSEKPGLDVERLLDAFHTEFCSPHGHPREYDRPVILKVAAEYDRLAPTGSEGR